MISAEVIKSVQQLLQERGIEQKTNEKFGDYVARGLGISSRQADLFLQLLNEGKSVDGAIKIAEIDTTTVSEDLLNQDARAIGSALGRMASGKL